MTTTSPRDKTRTRRTTSAAGDKAFFGLSWTGGVIILVVLAFVALFLYSFDHFRHLLRILLVRALMRSEVSGPMFGRSWPAQLSCQPSRWYWPLR